MRATAWLWRCALVLSFGALALIFLSPQVRARRARRRKQCVICRGNQQWQRASVAFLALLVLAGSLLRVHQVNATTPPPCEAQWFVAGQRLPAAPEQTPPKAWEWTRNVVTAPITGMAYGYAKARGMGLCGVGPITVAFLPRAASTSGTTLGGVFLTRVQPRITEKRAEALASHESRHVTQWTVLTLAGGPLALPVAYSIDEVFFPGSRNHFERDAGLGKGGYTRPPGHGPQPLWGPAAAIGLIALIWALPRLRRLSRVAASGTSGAYRTEPARCPLHSRRWFRGP